MEVSEEGWQKRKVACVHVWSFVYTAPTLLSRVTCIGWRLGVTATDIRMPQRALFVSFQDTTRRNELTLLTLHNPILVRCSPVHDHLRSSPPTPPSYLHHPLQPPSHAPQAPGVSVRLRGTTSQASHALPPSACMHGHKSLSAGQVHAFGIQRRRSGAGAMAPGPRCE